MGLLYEDLKIRMIHFDLTIANINAKKSDN